MLRGRLNGLVRPTKGRAKSVDLLVNPLALVFAHKLKLDTTKERESENTLSAARLRL